MTGSSLPQLKIPLANRLRARRARLVWWWSTRKLPLIKRSLDIVLVLSALVAVDADSGAAGLLSDEGAGGRWRRGQPIGRHVGGTHAARGIDGEDHGLVG